MKGKITILNNLALAPLIYISSVIDTPENAIKEVDRIIQNFIWEGKTAKLKKKYFNSNHRKWCSQTL